MTENGPVTGSNSDASVNPWLGIWLQPRQAIRTILKHNPDYAVKPLPIILAMVQMLPGVLQFQVLAFHFRLLFVLIAGILSGLIGLYYMGWIYGFVGRWFGGQGTSVETRAAFAWAQLPNLLSATIVAASFFLAQNGMFSRVLITFIQAVVGIVFALWSLVLICQTLGEAHGFSGWRGFFTVFVGSIVSTLPIFVLGIVLAVALPMVIGQMKMPAKSHARNSSVNAVLAQFQNLIPSKLTTAVPAKVSTPSVPLPVLNVKRGIPGVSDTDLDAMRYASAQVEVKLSSGEIISGVVLDASENNLYLDVDGMARNIPKRDIVSLVKAGEKKMGEVNVAAAQTGVKNAGDETERNLETT